LRDAWERLRETAADFGEQRIYASHNSIMFARKSAYFFVRPKRSFLEVWVFLGRPLKAPQVRKAEATSKTKFGNLIQIRHRDEVEAPVTDWLREAYDFGGATAVKAAAAPVRRGLSSDRPASKKKAAKKAVTKKAAKRTARARGPKRAARPRR